MFRVFPAIISVFQYGCRRGYKGSRVLNFTTYKFYDEHISQIIFENFILKGVDLYDHTKVFPSDPEPSVPEAVELKTPNTTEMPKVGECIVALFTDGSFPGEVTNV